MPKTVTYNKKVLLGLTAETVAEVKRIAELNGKSSASVYRYAIDQFIGQDSHHMEANSGPIPVDADHEKFQNELPLPAPPNGTGGIY